MATASSNIGTMGTNVPVGKTVPTATTGMTGTQPGQSSAQMTGMGQGSVGTISGTAGAHTTTGGQTGMQMGDYRGEQGNYGQHENRRSMFDSIEEWFRDPFNLGFGSRGRDRRAGEQQGMGYGQGQEVGMWGGNRGAFGMLPFGSDIFSDFDRTLFNLGSFTPSMKLDIKESEASFNCNIDMPGVSSNDLNVECDDRTRTIHVNVRKDRREEKDEDVNGTRVHRIERASGSGYRAIRMPPNCDLNNVQANLSNGVLYLTVPKIHGMDTFGRKRITIGSGMGSTGSGSMGTGTGMGAGSNTGMGTSAPTTANMGSTGTTGMGMSGTRNM